MKEKLVDILSTVFGLCMFIAVFTGAVTTVIYISGFILGGSLGEAAAKFGALLVWKAVPLSAFGSVVGMLCFYIQGTHELTMDNKSSNKKS